MVSLCSVILRSALDSRRAVSGFAVLPFLAAVILITGLSLKGLCHPLAAALDMLVALWLLAGALR